MASSLILYINDLFSDDDLLLEASLLNIKELFDNNDDRSIRAILAKGLTDFHAIPRLLDILKCRQHQYTNVIHYTLSIISNLAVSEYRFLSIAIFQSYNILDVLYETACTPNLALAEEVLSCMATVLGILGFKSMPLTSDEFGIDIIKIIKKNINHTNIVALCIKVLSTSLQTNNSDISYVQLCIPTIVNCMNISLDVVIDVLTILEDVSKASDRRISEFLSLLNLSKGLMKFLTINAPTDILYLILNSIYKINSNLRCKDATFTIINDGLMSCFQALIIHSNSTIRTVVYSLVNSAQFDLVVRSDILRVLLDSNNKHLIINSNLDILYILSLTEEKGYCNNKYLIDIGTIDYLIDTIKCTDMPSDNLIRAITSYINHGYRSRDEYSILHSKLQSRNFYQTISNLKLIDQFILNINNSNILKHIRLEANNSDINNNSSQPNKKQK